MKPTTASQLVKRSAAAAIFTLSLCPAVRGAAPGFYSAPPQYGPATSPHAEAPPFAGVQNYGMQSPAFRYGWFGAEHFYPTHECHRDYYGNVMQWSRWRRY
jgi:hypothetical protein